jgi:hypothetical protein
VAVPTPDLEELSRRFVSLAEVDCRDYSPLYERLSLGIAGDPELLELLARARPGQRRPVLFLAAVHHLLLRGLDHPLAAVYPSIAGPDVAQAADPFPLFRALCLDHRDEVLGLVETRATQTNEVGARCCSRSSNVCLVPSR